MGRLISEKYAAWQAECEERFQQLKKNEEELNRIFIDIYGLQDELTPDVADKDVTVHRVFDSKDDVPESMKGSNYVRTMRDEIVSLISYAVGCMFGRYSLDVDGLAYAGGEWDTSKYKTIIPDNDNIIPICDDEYFDDDITGRFVEFVRKVYGDDMRLPPNFPSALSATQRVPPSWSRCRRSSRPSRNLVWQPCFRERAFP